MIRTCPTFSSVLAGTLFTPRSPTALKRFSQFLIASAVAAADAVTAKWGSKSLPVVDIKESQHKPSLNAPNGVFYESKASVMWCGVGWGGVSGGWGVNRGLGQGMFGLDTGYDYDLFVMGRLHSTIGKKGPAYPIKYIACAAVSLDTALRKESEKRNTVYLDEV